MKRIATALVLIPLVVWLALFAREWIFAAFLAAFGLLAFHEFSRIVEENGFHPPALPGMAAGLALMFAPPLMTVVLTAILAMTIALRAELSKSLASAAAFLLGVVYIFGAWRCALELRAIDANWLMFA